MNAEVVSFIFKCINLAVFSGIAYYLIKTRLVPIIRERMRVQQERQDYKIAHENGLKKEIEVMYVRLQEQKNQAQELIKKAQLWKSAVAQQRDVLARERVRCKKLTEEYLELVQKGIHQEYLIKSTMPEVLDQLEKDARLYYQDNEHVTKALDTIFVSLPKRMQ
jgi:predicted nuclease with TOPRIM domain